MKSVYEISTWATALVGVEVLLAVCGQCYKTVYGRNYIAISVTQSKSKRNTPLVV
jgi:hypothetical protein